MTTNQFMKTIQVTLSVTMSQSCSVTTVVITVSIESLCQQIVYSALPWAGLRGSTPPSNSNRPTQRAIYTLWRIFPCAHVCNFLGVW